MTMLGLTGLSHNPGTGLMQASAVCSQAQSGRLSAAVSTLLLSPTALPWMS